MSERDMSLAGLIMDESSIPFDEIILGLTWSGWFERNTWIVSV